MSFSMPDENRNIITIDGKDIEYLGELSFERYGINIAVITSKEKGLWRTIFISYLKIDKVEIIKQGDTFT